MTDRTLLDIIRAATPETRARIITELEDLIAEAKEIDAPCPYCPVGACP